MPQEPDRSNSKNESTEKENLSGATEDTPKDGQGASAQKPPIRLANNEDRNDNLETGDPTNVTEIASNASSGLPTAQGDSIKALFASTDELARIDLDEPQEVLSASGNILNSYYTVALAQSARSFVWALVAAGAGVVFFIAAITFLLVRDSVEAATVSAIGGAIVELVAGLNFYLYGKANEQAASHRFSLEKMQRYLLANSIIESLSTAETKDDSRAKLVSAMAEEDRTTSRGRDKNGTRGRDKNETP
jgi:hypothetical protein